MFEQLIAIAMDSIEVKYKNFKTYLISQKQSFLDAVKTDVTFVNPATAREQSSKSVNPTTYDRYEKYHFEAGEITKFDKVLGNSISNVIDNIKKVIVK